MDLRPLPIHLLISHSYSLQKEPKLDRARQIPEWEVYDNEIAAFARRLQEGTPSVGGGQEEKSALESDAPHTRDEL